MEIAGNYIMKPYKSEMHQEVKTFFINTSINIKRIKANKIQILPL